MFAKKILIRVGTRVFSKARHSLDAGQREAHALADDSIVWGTVLSRAGPTSRSWNVRWDAGAVESTVASVLLKKMEQNGPADDDAGDAAGPAGGNPNHGDGSDEEGGGPSPAGSDDSASEAEDEMEADVAVATANGQLWDKLEQPVTLDGPNPDIRFRIRWDNVNFTGLLQNTHDADCFFPWVEACY